jgi:hypothetical protein
LIDFHSPPLVAFSGPSTLLSNTRVSELEWWAPGYSFYTDMRVLELEAYDTILGYVTEPPQK